MDQQLRFSNHDSDEIEDWFEVSGGAGSVVASCCIMLHHVASCLIYVGQVHAQSHLTRHIKIPPPLASTCTVSTYTSNQNPTPSGKLHISSYTSYQNPTPSGKYMHSLILHVISKSHPLWQDMSHILHVISKAHPLWQVHAQSHLVKSKNALASTCTVSSYTSPPLASDMVISKSHPLWQVHAQYTSYQNPTPSGVHAQSHLTRHIKIPPPLAGTVQWLTACQDLLASTALSPEVKSKSHTLWQVRWTILLGLYLCCLATSHITRSKSHPLWQHMQGHILHVISKAHPLWQDMQSHILHVISKSHPLWHMHSLILSYQNPTPSEKVHGSVSFVRSILGRRRHWMPNSLLRLHLWCLQRRWQDAKTVHMKIPPPLASTCTVSSYSHIKIPPSLASMRSLILQIKIPPPLASTYKVAFALGS